MDGDIDVDVVQTLNKEELAEAWVDAQAEREKALCEIEEIPAFAEDRKKLQELDDKIFELKGEAEVLNRHVVEGMKDATCLVDNEIKAIEAELLNKFDPDEGFSFETDRAKVKFNKSVKVIVDDKAMIAEVLVKNHKASEGINTFYLGKLRGFIDMGLLDGAAHLDEIIKPAISLKMMECAKCGKKTPIHPEDLCSDCFKAQEHQ